MRPFANRRRRAARFGAVDVFGITSCIVILSLILGSLLAARHPIFAAQAQRWIRTAWVTLSDLGAAHADAEAPTSARP
jgi:hypothetical protein